MKERHLYILAGVFFVLLIVYFITKPRLATVNYDDIVQTVLFGISNDDVKEIEVYKQAGDKEIRMQLVKREDQWYIPTRFNAKAREYSVKRIIDDLIDMTGKVRSSDPKHQEMFQVTDEQGIHVILKDEAQKTLANLIVGKKGEDYSTGFVRFAGKEKIYAVDKNILSSLSIHSEIDTLSKFKYNSFIDLQAVNMDKNTLQIAALVHQGKEMVIKKIEKEVEQVKQDSTATDTAKAPKKEYEWVLLKNDKEIKLDQKEVDKFFRDVASINTQEVVDHIGNTLEDLSKAGKYKFGRSSSYIVFIKEEDNTKYNIVFGKEYEKDKGYYMQVQEDNLVYKVTKSKYDTIFKWVNELPTKLPKKEDEKEKA